MRIPEILDGSSHDIQPVHLGADARKERPPSHCVLYNSHPTPLPRSGKASPKDRPCEVHDGNPKAKKREHTHFQKQLAQQLRETFRWLFSLQQAGLADEMSSSADLIKDFVSHDFVA